MKNYLLAIVVFVVLFPIIFLAALVYHNSFEILKKAIFLDFKSIKRVEIWISFFISLLISAMISYAML